MPESVIPRAIECALPRGTAEDAQAQLCARYEALFDLSARMRSRSCIKDLADIVCQQWRFCANVASWRMLGEIDGVFVLIDGIGANATVTHLTSLESLPTEQMLWERRLPQRIPLNAIKTSRLQLASHLCVEGVPEVLIRPVDNKNRGEKFLLLVAAGVGGFNRIDLRFIGAVSSILASEIGYISATTRLTDALALEAMHDPLTGLPNRRFFDSQYSKYWRNCFRTVDPLSFLIIDVDYFKKYNDTFGHPAGDECLKRVARAIRQSFGRPLDFCARIGGEEFGVLLPNTPAEGAVRAAERLIEAVHREAIPHMVDDQPTHVTLSIGTATIYSIENLEPEVLVKAADDALYRAKRGGRDRVCQAGELKPTPR